MIAFGGVGRVVAYVIAAAVSSLLLATVSERRLASYASVAAVALLAIAVGGLNAAIASLLKRDARSTGCLPFAVVALAANATLMFGVALLAPSVRLTPWGIIVGAVVVTVVNGIVFSLWDEPRGAG